MSQSTYISQIHFQTLKSQAELEGQPTANYRKIDNQIFLFSLHNPKS